MAIEYRIRTHPRARHVRLRIARDGSVAVTVPPGFDRCVVERLVAERHQWIAEARARMASRRQQLDPALCGRQPKRIVLPAVGERWQVVYGSASGLRVRFEEDRASLRLLIEARGADPDEQQLAELLRRWLIERARRHLVPLVGELAELYGFRPGRISIRTQRSRWGSCSGRGNLSLNARLLLVSEQACRHVLIHELVHLEHPNHSTAFYRRLAELDPNHKEAIAELKSAWYRMPDWLAG